MGIKFEAVKFITDMTRRGSHDEQFFFTGILFLASMPRIQKYNAPKEKKIDYFWNVIDDVINYFIRSWHATVYFGSTLHLPALEKQTIRSLSALVCCHRQRGHSILHHLHSKFRSNVYDMARVSEIN